MLKKKACDYFGSQRAIALALGLSDAAVSQWRSVIPESAALKIERITRGELKYENHFYDKSIS